MSLKFYNWQLDGIDYSDAPKFCDAYICYAEDETGQPLTDAQLEELNNDSELVHRLVYEHLY